MPTVLYCNVSALFCHSVHANDYSAYLRQLTLFVSGIIRKTTQPISTKFDGKVAHEPRKKRLDFGGNPDHVTLGFEFGLGEGQS